MQHEKHKKMIIEKLSSLMKSKFSCLFFLSCFSTPHKRKKRNLFINFLMKRRREKIELNFYEYFIVMKCSRMMMMMMEKVGYSWEFDAEKYDKFEVEFSIKNGGSSSSNYFLILSSTIHNIPKPKNRVKPFFIYYKFITNDGWF